MKGCHSSDEQKRKWLRDPASIHLRQDKDRGDSFGKSEKQLVSPLLVEVIIPIIPVAPPSVVVGVEGKHLQN